MRHVVLFALAELTGCLFIRPGAPLGATTVGKGKVGLAFAGEGPAIQPIANDTNTNATSTTYRIGHISTAPATSVSLAMGIADDTDIELSAEGAGIIPLGGSLGMRHHIGASELFDFAIAARLGGLWGSGANLDANADSGSFLGIYAGVEGVAERRRGAVRPLLALELMPFTVADSEPSEEVQHFTGVVSSLTFGVDLLYGIVQLEPYATVSDVANDNHHLAGGAFVTGGLMLAFRPDHDRPPLPGPPPPGPPASP